MRPCDDDALSKACAFIEYFERNPKASIAQWAASVEYKPQYAMDRARVHLRWCTDFFPSLVVHLSARASGAHNCYVRFKKGKNYRKPEPCWADLSKHQALRTARLEAHEFIWYFTVYSPGSTIGDWAYKFGHPESDASRLIRRRIRDCTRFFPEIRATVYAGPAAVGGGTVRIKNKPEAQACLSLA